MIKRSKYAFIHKMIYNYLLSLIIGRDRKSVFDQWEEPRACSFYTQWRKKIQSVVMQYSHNENIQFSNADSRSEPCI